MKRIRRYGAVVAGLAAAAFVVVTTSGCGAANTLDPVAKAASISTTTPGFQMRFEVRFGSPQLPTALTATGTGSIDARDRAGSVVFVMNAGTDPERHPDNALSRDDQPGPGAGCAPVRITQGRQAGRLVDRAADRAKAAAGGCLD